MTEIASLLKNGKDYIKQKSHITNQWRGVNRLIAYDFYHNSRGIPTWNPEYFKYRKSIPEF